jgi:hypothetical protein
MRVKCILKTRPMPAAERFCTLRRQISTRCRASRTPAVNQSDWKGGALASFTG